MNDLENAFNVFVKEFGGKVVHELVGSSPTFNNADYLFEKYKVIAELKCMEEDKLRDDKFIEKASSIYLEAHQKGGTQVVLFGTRRISSDAFTPEYQESMLKIYEQPIRNLIKKANKQIRDTKNHLGKDAYDGVLLLINSGNLALDPAHVVQLLDRMFSRGLYKSIDYTIFLTVNLTAKHSSLVGEHMVYRRSKGNENFDQFEASFRKAWQRHLEYNLGVKIPFQVVDERIFNLLENINNGRH